MTVAFGSAAGVSNARHVGRTGLLTHALEGWTLSVVTEEDITSHLKRTSADLDSAFEAWFSRFKGAPDRLVEAMRYSLEAGGKRLRPALVIWGCEFCDGSKEAAMPAAMAVECVHTFSLIHDDLPALDNDDLRRGRPANHKRFGEAIAVLAGDALLAMAFEIIALSDATPAAIAPMVGELSTASGWRGMIGGEVADVQGEAGPASRALVASIHAAKTARLIESSCRLGGMAAGAPEERVEALGRYGHSLGLAFQAIDDLLDVTETSETLGKRTRKDAALGKQSYPRAVGIDETRRIAKAAADRAAAALETFGPQASRLISLARFVVERRC